MNYSPRRKKRIKKDTCMSNMQKLLGLQSDLLNLRWKMYMGNPIHTHTTDLEIICAGETVVHELRVMYMYYPGSPAFQHRMPISGAVYDVSPPEPAQVEIHKIMEFVIYETPDCKTALWHTQKTKYSELAWDHKEALEAEILENHES